MSSRAFRYEATIGPSGKIELAVPLPPGTPVEVIVLPPAEDDFGDLVHAASSSTEFWDHPLDDQDWNDA